MSTPSLGWRHVTTAFIATTLVGCSGGDAPSPTGRLTDGPSPPATAASTATARPSPVAVPDGYTAIDDGSLPPGDYAAVGFAVPFAFTIPARFGDTDWTVFDTGLYTVLSFGHGEGLGMTFMVPTLAFDDAGQAPVSGPSSWADWLAAHQGLEVVDQATTAIGGSDAVWLDVEAQSAPDNDICGAGGLDGVRVASSEEIRAPVTGAVCTGFPKRIYVAEVAGTQLLVFVDHEILEDSLEVLDTVAFIE